MCSDPAAHPAPSLPKAKLSWMQHAAMFPIRVYRLTLSWALGNQCRFTPTCSRYGLEAIEVHGAFKGWWLTLGRIWRCQPFYPGGYDPVPPLKGTSRETERLEVNAEGAEIAEDAEKDLR